jgi:hypothetical protein
MNIAILTLSIGNEFRKITSIGLLTKELYCIQHNFDFIDPNSDDLNGINDIIDYNRPLPWSKVKLINKYLLNEKYDYLIWMDGDTLIMNSDISCIDLINELSQNKDLMFTTDWKMINTGVMFIKRSQWSIDFFNHIWNMTDYINSDCWEQDAIKYCFDNNILNTDFHGIIIPWAKQKRFNSYWYNWSYGDFLLHFAGCFRINKIALNRMMIQWSPIKIPNESFDSFKYRQFWLQNIASNDMVIELEKQKNS